jgi:hypothetical protein
LPGVVPLIERLPGVDALVALQADQIGAEHTRERAPDLRLPDARLAFQQQRTAHGEREVERDREAAIGEVRLGAKRGLEVVRARERHSFTVAPPL